jgi:hypothetical protein
VLDAGGSIQRLCPCAHGADGIARFRLRLGDVAQSGNLCLIIFERGGGRHRPRQITSSSLHHGDLSTGGGLQISSLDGGDRSQRRGHILGIGLPQRYDAKRKVSEPRILNRRDGSPGLQKNPLGFSIGFTRVGAGGRRYSRACQEARAKENREGRYLDR